MAPATMPPARASDTVHVLVVDDSAVMRQVMTAVLMREPGFTVDVAAHPLIAKTKMDRHRPDVIVLDLEMPHMDGLTFLQRIMASDPIPVLVCSALARGGADTVLRALEYGAVDVVQKPATGIQDFLYESAVLLVDKVRGAARARATDAPVDAVDAANPAAQRRRGAAVRCRGCCRSRPTRWSPSARLRAAPRRCASR